jgi:hypothetical protein
MFRGRGVPAGVTHCARLINTPEFELALRDNVHVFSGTGHSRGETTLLCPACQSDSPRRSRRRSIKDYAVGATLLRPWRCRSCDLRFYAWAAPIRYVYYVHCGMCGNMDLQRISSEHGTGMFAWLFRLLRVPTYRCAPCRNRFFSFRIYRRIIPIDRPIDTHTESHTVAH